MNTLFDLITNALSLGGVYALLALGLAIVFSILHLVNFAHGELIAVTGYSMYLLALIGLPWAYILILAIVIAVVAALLMERIAFRPVRNVPTAGLMTSFAVMMILQVAWSNLISNLRRPVVIPEFLSGTVTFGDFNVSALRLIAIGVSAAALISLNQFLTRTNIGIAMRAAAEDYAVTRLMGIRANRVVATAFAISGLLAGVAGILWIGERATVDPHMGLAPVLKAFIAVVFGGLNSLTSAVLGGLVLAAVEVAFGFYLPAGLIAYRDALSLTVVILVLLKWPGGLLSILQSTVKSS